MLGNPLECGGVAQASGKQLPDFSGAGFGAAH